MWKLCDVNVFLWDWRLALDSGHLDRVPASLSLIMLSCSHLTRLFSRKAFGTERIEKRDGSACVRRLRHRGQERFCVPSRPSQPTICVMGCHGWLSILLYSQFVLLFFSFLLYFANNTRTPILQTLKRGGFKYIIFLQGNRNHDTLSRNRITTTTTTSRAVFFFPTW